MMQRSGVVYKSALCRSVHWFLFLSCVSEVPALSPSSGRKQHIFFPLSANEKQFILLLFHFFSHVCCHHKSCTRAYRPVVNNNQYPAWFWDILAHICFFKNSCSSMPDPHFCLRENLSRTVDAAGQRLVRAGCVIVAGGGRPQGIGGQIPGQQHRWHWTAKSHQGNTGVRAAHRWGGETHTAQSAQSSVICCFLTAKACPECESLNSSLYGLIPTWCFLRIDVCVPGVAFLCLFTWIKRDTNN